MRAATAGAYLGLLACAPLAEAPYPGLPGGRAARTLVFLDVPSLDDPDRVTGRVQEGPAFIDTSIDRSSEDLLLLYERSPAELGWPVGPIVHDPTQRGRLRVPDAIVPLAGASTTAAALGAALRRLRFAVPPGDACERGCLVGDPSSDPGLYCGPSCAPFEVALPATPALPELRCPGDRTPEADAFGLLRCVIATSSCAAGERLDVDGRCLMVGAPCPITDDFAAAPAGVVARYVVPEPADLAVADGSRARPWRLDQAVAAASEGDALLLSKGAHRWPALRPTAATLALVGACAAETSLEGGSLLVATELRARDLTIDAGGIDLQGALEGRGLIVRTARSVHVRASGRLDLDDALLTSSGDRPSIEVRGTATASRSEARELQWSASGGRVTLWRARVEVSGESALVASAGGVIDAVELIARHSATASVTAVAALVDRGSARIVASILSGGAYNALVRNEGHLELVESTLVDPTVDQQHGLIARAGGLVIARDVYASDGFRLETGTRADLERIASGGARKAGIEARGAELEVRDLTVRGAFYGVGLYDGSNVTMARVAIERPVEVGIQAYGREALDRGPRVALSDVRITDAGGFGVLSTGARVTDRIVELVVRRLQIERVRGAAIVLGAAAVRMDASDVTLRGITPLENEGLCMGRGAACSGVGIRARTEGGGLKLRRFTVDSYAETAIYTATGVDFDAAHGRIGPGRFGVSYLGDDPWAADMANVEIAAEVPFVRP